MSTVACLSLVNDRAQFATCQASLRTAAAPLPLPEWLMVEPNAHGWNAAQGLNHGIDVLQAEWIVCVHQDVLFPRGYWQRLTAALASLASDVAVAGIVGNDRSGHYRGHIVDPNGHCFWPSLPRDVLVVDEVPGFHCYGADLCYAAAARGHRVVTVDAPLVHLSTGVVDDSYQRAAAWLLAKWGPRHGHVLATPTRLLVDCAKAGWWRHWSCRWRQRGDRFSRNQNDCGDPGCRAALGAMFTGARNGSARVGSRPAD